jgi:hypothetical protein
LCLNLNFTKESQEDRRKNNKGFVCTQINNKGLLLKIAKDLGIKESLIDVNINKICDMIEILLRDRQEAENKKDKPIRWFIE